MKYKQEVEDQATRKRAVAEAKKGLLETWVWPMVDRVWPNVDPEFRERFSEDLIGSIVAGVHRYSAALARAEGVECRHGWHDRIKKLRYGVRSDHYGECYTRWFVLDREPGYLDRMIRELEVETDDPRTAVTEAKDRLALECEREHGFYPGEYGTGMEEVSPSGRWFGYVMVRQVGRRLLLEQNNSLDI